MNCISWNVGHLAWQEQRYFLHHTQGRTLYPDIAKEFAVGAPASFPQPGDRGVAGDHAGGRSVARHPDLDRSRRTCGQPGQTDCLHPRQPVAAGDLPLLVSHGREHGDPPAARAYPPAPVCRRHRWESALSTGSITRAGREVTKTGRSTYRCSCPPGERDHAFTARLPRSPGAEMAVFLLRAVGQGRPAVAPYHGYFRMFRPDSGTPRTSRALRTRDHLFAALPQSPPCWT